MAKKDKSSRPHWPDEPCECLACFRKRTAFSFSQANEAIKKQANIIEALNHELEAMIDRVFMLENELGHAKAFQHKTWLFMQQYQGAMLAPDNSAIVKRPLFTKFKAVEVPTIKEMKETAASRAYERAKAKEPKQLPGIRGADYERSEEMDVEPVFIEGQREPVDVKRGVAHRGYMITTPADENTCLECSAARGLEFWEFEEAQEKLAEVMKKHKECNPDTDCRCSLQPIEEGEHGQTDQNRGD